MAGGSFDKSVGKVRPGTYINFEDTRIDIISGSERGTVVIPLANTDYGPQGSFIRITADGLDAAKAYLGYSVYDSDPANNMLLIREAFKGASTVIVYICTEGTKAAEGTGGGLKATAKFKGARGNALSYAVLTNPAGGFDVEVYLAGSRIEIFEEVTQASELTDSEWITFTAAQGAETLVAVSGVPLTGGTSGTTSNEDIASFLDATEGVRFNTIAFPFVDTSLKSALKTKIKYMREKVGRGVQGVAPDFKADYDGIISVTNSYALGEAELTNAQATAYVAGITAGANNVTSNTYKIVDGATGVVGLKTHEEAVAAINNGEFFFSVSEAGNVTVEYDINSFTSFTAKKGPTYRKNRVTRVFDSFAEALQLNFPPNKFDNDPDGWASMEGVGRSILKRFGPRSDGGVGAIKNIDYDTDFLVDKEMSTGDETYFNVGLEPVDSAEKLYFTIATR